MESAQVTPLTPDEIRAMVAPPPTTEDVGQRTYRPTIVWVVRFWREDATTPGAIAQDRAFVDHVRLDPYYIVGLDSDTILQSPTRKLWAMDGDPFLVEDTPSILQMDNLEPDQYEFRGQMASRVIFLAFRNLVEATGWLQEHADEIPGLSRVVYTYDLRPDSTPSSS